MVTFGLKPLKDDESGIAWGLAAAFMFLVMGGALYVFFAPIINSLINPFNTFVSMNLVTQDTADAVAFGVNVWIFLPIVIIFGVFGWIVVRAHERGGN